MKTHAPIHPGEVLREDFLEMTVAELDAYLDSLPKR